MGWFFSILVRNVFEHASTEILFHLTCRLAAMGEEASHMMRGSHFDQLPRGGETGDEAGRLDSWKEIANFFRREVRTVQLWERHEHLPVHRHHHRKVGTVHAYRMELQEWWDRRCSGGAAETAAPSEAAVPRLMHRLARRASRGEQERVLAVVGFATAIEGERSPHAWHSFNEQIATNLEAILPPRLRVVRNLTAAQRHAEGFSIDEANCGFNADYALEGSVTGDAKCIEVRLQLKRMKEDAVIWSRVCAYRNTPAAEAAADLADTVARALSHHVLMSHQQVKSKTVNPAARFAYLRGRYLWSLRSTPLSLFSALEQFQLATRLDPNYAPAFSGLADCYTVLGWFGAIPREIAMREARTAATKALAVDGFLAEAHVSMGYVHFDFDWDWEAAEREMLLGIDLNPSYAQGYCWYGLLLISLGRTAEAVQASQVAQELDPASPVVGAILGSALFHAGEHDAAIQQFQHVLHLQPDHAMAHCRLGLVYEQAGDYHQAIEHLQHAVKASAGDTNMQSTLAFVYARSGNRGAAEALLRGVHQLEERQPVPAIDAAAAYTALGDHESAIRCLYAGFEQRNTRLTALTSDPRLQPLHGDPRFSSLARQMRLA
jgi:tetratricopeptide (TPR) repeat protein